MKSDDTIQRSWVKSLEEEKQGWLSLSMEDDVKSIGDDFEAVENAGSTTPEEWVRSPKKCLSMKDFQIITQNKNTQS